MSKTEILEELPNLTADERNEIRLKLAELDGDDWLDADDPLTDEEKALLDARLAELEQHPEKSIPWEDAKNRIGVRFGPIRLNHKPTADTLNTEPLAGSQRS